MIWDDVLENVRAEFTNTTRQTTERSKAIAAALEEYLRAHEVRLAREFAQRNGLPLPGHAEDVDVAALRLRDLVAALPELGAETSAMPAAAAVHPRPTRRKTMELLTLEEAQRQLATEFEATRFAAMRLDEFLSLRRGVRGRRPRSPGAYGG